MILKLTEKYKKLILLGNYWNVSTVYLTKKIIKFFIVILKGKNYFIIIRWKFYYFFIIKPIINYLKNNDLDINMIKDYFNTRHFMFYKKTIFKNISVTEPGKFYEFNLKNFKLNEKFYDNPVNWINKKLYFSLNKSNEIEIKNKLKSLMSKNAELMISNINLETFLVEESTPHCKRLS